MREGMLQTIIGKVRMFFWGVVFLMPVSCISDYNADYVEKRTVLVYIAADNNLSQFANPNIKSMSSGFGRRSENLNLLVFVDRKDVVPVLLHVNSNEIDTVKVYPELNSADTDVLREVIDYVCDNWKSDSYGLVLWSHGTGWVPTNQLNYVAPNLGWIQSRDGSTPLSDVLAWQRYPSVETKAFAWEDRSKGTPRYSCMEIDALTDAIPEGVFDYIVFDACYMGNVEVIYALRNKTRYIVSSCYEIEGYGFPYDRITRDLMNGNLIKTCREFYDYYSISGTMQMAGVSLVKTDGLDSLASCFRKIVEKYGDRVPDMDISDIQYLDRFRNHICFDLEDFLDKLDIDNEYLTEFRLQLERCIPYKVSTPYIFKDTFDEIKIDRYCGMSVYIPVREYDSHGLNEDYRKTEWSINTGYGY